MNETVRRFALSSYVVAALFVVMPIVDVVTQVWPPDPGTAQWRYGTVGIASNYLISIGFGLLLALLVGSAAGHRAMVLVASVLAALCAVGLVFASLSFVLDVLQLRGGVRPEGLWIFQVGAAKALFKTAATALAVGVMSVAGFKAWRADRRGAKATPPLVKPGA